jgi:hypothetical protein
MRLACPWSILPLPDLEVRNPGGVGRRNVCTFIEGWKAYKAGEDPLKDLLGIRSTEGRNRTRYVSIYQRKQAMEARYM